MKQKNLFEICVSKKTTPAELFQWIGFEKDWDVLDIGDRYLRLLGSGESVEISEPKKTFDRWANSSSETFDLQKKSERKAFLKVLISFNPEMENKLLN